MHFFLVDDTFVLADDDTRGCQDCCVIQSVSTGYGTLIHGAGNGSLTRTLIYFHYNKLSIKVNNERGRDCTGS